MLEIINLQCERGDRRLFSGLNCALSSGELLHLHGHNGSGKTTLLRTLCGLILPTEGEIHWNGESILKQRDEFHQHLLYIGHKNSIKDDLSAVENLMFSAQLKGWAIDEEKAWHTLESVGLYGHEDLPTKYLSQGQKRRVTLAQLMVTSARLWVLDEPFVALDKVAVGQLQALIETHVDGGGMVVMTTHQEVSLTQGAVRQLQLGVGECGHA